MCDCKYETFFKKPFVREWPLTVDGIRVWRYLDYQTCQIHGKQYSCSSSSLTLAAMATEDLLLSKTHTRINLHAHTKWSDGSNTIEEMAIISKERGMPACVISDHDYMLMTPRGCDTNICFSNNMRDSELGKQKYLAQCEEAERVSKQLNYPVIIGIEASMYRVEEALLFGKEAILTFFDERNWLISQGEDGIFEYPNFRKKNHALVVVHPSPIRDDRFNVELGLFKLAHGYEIVNTQHLWGEEEINKMIELCPHGTPFFNIDAHGAGSQKKYYCNLISRDIRIQNEEDLINWIKTRKVDWTRNYNIESIRNQTSWP